MENSSYWADKSAREIVNDLNAALTAVNPDDETRAAIMWQQCAAADFHYAQLCNFDPRSKIMWMDFAAKSSENARRHLWKLIGGNDAPNA